MKKQETDKEKLTNKQLEEVTGGVETKVVKISKGGNGGKKPTVTA